MTTLEMEISLMSFFCFRKNLIVPNVSWGMRFASHYKSLHECDLLILSSSGYATEVEIKISKADLLKDKKKKHKHKHPAIKNLYFAVPAELKECAVSEIPEHSGLITVKDNGNYIFSTIERKALPRKNALKWSDKDRLALARLGTMRIYGLKKNLLKNDK